MFPTLGCWHRACVFVQDEQTHEFLERVQTRKYWSAVGLATKVFVQDEQAHRLLERVQKRKSWSAMGLPMTMFVQDKQTHARFERIKERKRRFTIGPDEYIETVHTLCITQF
jgi:uncharacterized Zn finger protein